VSAVDGTLLCRTAFEIRDEKEERLTFSRGLRVKFFFFFGDLILRINSA
jgi:hypothetical protein